MRMGRAGTTGQYANAVYNDASQAASMQDGMRTQPSVGRFTEQEKASSMFSRKPATLKYYDGSQALAGQSNHGLHHSGQSNAGGIVNLRQAPTSGEGKMNKSTSKEKK